MRWLRVWSTSLLQAPHSSSAWGSLLHLQYRHRCGTSQVRATRTKKPVNRRYLERPAQLSQLLAIVTWLLLKTFLNLPLERIKINCRLLNGPEPAAQFACSGGRRCHKLGYFCLCCCLAGQNVSSLN